MPRSGSKTSKGSHRKRATTTNTGSPQLLFDLPESIYAVVAGFLRVKQALRVASTCARLHLPHRPPKPGTFLESSMRIIM